MCHSDWRLLLAFSEWVRAGNARFPVVSYSAQDTAI